MEGRYDRRRWLQTACGALLTASASRRVRAQQPLPPRAAAGEHVFTPRARQATDDGLAFLARRQNEDGSFGSGVYQSNLAVCGLAGMAFLSAGHRPDRGPYGATLNRCVNYILNHTHDSGFIYGGQASTRGPMYEHGFATLFLSEVYGNSAAPGLRDKLAKATQLIVNTQNDAGGWRYEPRRQEDDLSVTVCEVMALRAAHNAGLYVPSPTIDKAMDYVRRCQNADGGFRYIAATPGESAFPRSAAAVVALYSGGIYEGPELSRALDYLIQFRPPRNDSVGSGYFFYGHYYAVQAMWHAGGRYWAQWYPAIRDLLLAQQRRQDGAWADAISSEYGTAMACLVLRMPESYLPIFER